MSSTSNHDPIEWIRWAPGSLSLDFLIDADRHIYLCHIRPTGSKSIVYGINKEVEHALPLTQIRLLGEGSIFGTSERQVYSATSSRLVYVSHQELPTDDDTCILEILTRDPLTKIEILNRYTVFGEVPVVRSTATVTNLGSKEVYLETFASLSLGYLNRGSEQWYNDFQVVVANSTNFREAQWKAFNFPDIGMDWVGESDFDKPGTRASISKSNLGTFSSSGSLPMGALVKKDGTSSVAWQIESSGSWQWELGNIVSGLYVVAGGPNDQNHQWTKKLSPQETFTSVTTALTVTNGPLPSVFPPLTQYRRRIRRKHADNENLPLIFNDYMNCLKGDPTTEKVTALIGPALRCGAEYFVIDAGWYAEEPGWWDTVGEWKPSTARFPGGLKTLLKEIRNKGMIPGLWMEPEVVGVMSPTVNELPPEAFFQRRGVRVVEQSRYQMDFRHEAVVSRLNAIIDDLVENYHVGYFKLDYNIDVTHGTDVDASSPGDGMLGHRRAYMSWINSVYDRYPDVVLETCSSGACRLDYEMLSTHSIQSTSDLQDPILYAGLAAGVPTAVTPEQSASWSYPQPHYTDDLNAYCMVNSILGRVHLSGRIDLLSHNQLQLIIEGCEVYKQIRHHIKDSVPLWPLGLDQWNEDWVVLGLQTGKHLYLGIWRRGGDAMLRVPLPDIVKDNALVQTLYPRAWETSLELCGRELNVTIPGSPSARLIHIKFL
ncbi:hypothetical protein QQS21_009516 [Conoideocrella luteorostrata]|uniref:alpha-galactosidase n=1 Tax=Conoideocrella luteorostrata TaxID=1105319 RepID=A0AAJ0CJ36_9HYPO|nr:hypothetical protein QQS21_009516 [Conoideocrella luteorostrata]